MIFIFFYQEGVLELILTQKHFIQPLFYVLTTVIYNTLKSESGMKRFLLRH